MDNYINNTNTTTTASTSSSSSWDLDMTTANPLLLDHHHHHHHHMSTPFEFLHPNMGQFHQQQQYHFPFPPNPQFNPNVPQDHLYVDNEAEDINVVDEDNDQQLGAMKEMMYKIAAMQPVDIDPSTIKKPKRRNVRISDDPQSIAARHRRERISERIRILQRLVPGGTKMDTASMLDEAIRYVKFLKRQVQELQNNPTPGGQVGTVVVGYGLGSPPLPAHAYASSSSSGLGFGFNSVDQHGTSNFR